MIRDVSAFRARLSEIEDYLKRAHANHFDFTSPTSMASRISMARTAERHALIQQGGMLLRWFHHHYIDKRDADQLTRRMFVSVQRLTPTDAEPWWWRGCRWTDTSSGRTLVDYCRKGDDPGSSIPYLLRLCSTSAVTQRADATSNAVEPHSM